jgi:hypothetical protein
MPNKKRVHVHPKRRKRKAKRGKGKSIKKSTGQHGIDLIPAISSALRDRGNEEKNANCDGQKFSL